ncbi:MAG: hypothetical protein FJ123_00315 [Deltaproteobacteria bacterium]|nr:hypothetical protein [Deltaproteobacteria bacterium]
MAKEKDCRVLEVRTGSGQLLLSLWLIEKKEAYPEPSKPEEKPAKETGGDGKKDQGKKDEAKKEPSPGNNDALMTDAQKRYLFRILAEQGFEGEKAHEELKKALGVDSLKKVSKFEASREIERRLEELKGGGVNG